MVIGAVASIAILIVQVFVLQIWSPFVAVLAPIGAFTWVGLNDRDAWIARRAIYQFGALQAARMTVGFPTNPESTAEWLADPANAGADDVTRAYALVNAGRAADAIALVDQPGPRSRTDEAAAERLRLTVQRDREGAVDRTQFDALMAGLAAPDRVWQEHALAAMLLVKDIDEGKPWRDRYVAAVRDLGPWDLPRRAWFVIVTQQFAMAIAFGVLFLILFILGGLPLL
jgi:hypothetical protein